MHEFYLQHVLIEFHTLYIFFPLHSPTNVFICFTNVSESSINYSIKKRHLSLKAANRALALMDKTKRVVVRNTVNDFGSKTLFWAIVLATLCSTTNTMCRQCPCRSKPSIQGTYKSTSLIEYYAVL